MTIAANRPWSDLDNPGMLMSFAWRFSAYVTELQDAFGEAPDDLDAVPWGRALIAQAFCEAAGDLLQPTWSGVADAAACDLAMSLLGAGGGFESPGRPYNTETARTLALIVESRGMRGHAERLGIA